jgi:hypothetical protein
MNGDVSAKLHHTALLLPMLAHAAMVLGLYAWLTVARAAAVKRGAASLATFVLGREEPPEVARITRNLANQFELPMFFHAAILVILLADAAGPFDHAMAWIFVAGRLAHTAVQTLGDNVALRGKVFMINVLGVMGLLAHVGLIALRGL